MTVFLIFMFLIGVFAVVGMPYMLIRNDRVCDFRIDILNNTQSMIGLRAFEKGPGYKDMLFSLKPLKLENWYTEEEIKTLKS